MRELRLERSARRECFLQGAFCCYPRLSLCLKRRIESLCLVLRILSIVSPAPIDHRNWNLAVLNEAPPPVRHIASLHLPGAMTDVVQPQYLANMILCCLGRR